MNKIITSLILSCFFYFFILDLSFAESKIVKFKPEVQSAEEIQELKKQVEKDIKEEEGTRPSFAGTSTATIEAFTRCAQGGLGQGGRSSSESSTWTRPNTSTELLSWEDAGTSCARGSNFSWSVDELRNEEGSKYGYRLNVACRGNGNYGGSGCMGKKITINYKQ